MANAIIGNIEKFAVGDDFDDYIERLEQLFILNNIEEEKKIPLFISFAGGDMFKTVKTVVAPKSVNEFKYDDIVEKLRDHLIPKKNMRIERQKFLTRTIRSNESLKDFISELKKLGTACDYGEFLETILCDKLVLSLKNGNIKRKLLEEPMTRSFDDICRTALEMEMRFNEIKLMAPAPVNHGQEKSSNTNSTKNKNPGKEAAKNSPSTTDKAAIKCSICQNTGHTHKSCPKNKPDNQKKSSKKSNKKKGSKAGDGAGSDSDSLPDIPKSK